MFRYLEDLREAAKREADSPRRFSFEVLADKLAEEKARPLTTSEKAVVRRALAAKVREMLDLAFEDYEDGMDPFSPDGPINKFRKVVLDLKD